MYHVPTCPRFPHPLQPPNIGVPIQSYSHPPPDQKRQGINYGGEGPYPCGMPSPTSYCDQNQMGKPNAMMNCPQPWNSPGMKSFSNQQGYNWWNAAYNWQAVEVRPPVLVGSPVPLNSLIQLHGNFKISKSDLKLSITHGKNERDARPFSIVHRVRTDGEALSNQFVFEEDKQFILRSKDKCVIAIIQKGTNVKHCVTWITKDDDNITIWERTREGTSQSPVQSTEPPRKYYPDPGTPGSCSPSFKSNSGESTKLIKDSSFNDMDRELNAQYSRMNVFDSNGSQFNSPRKYCCSSSAVSKYTQQDHTLFELIKAQCNSNSWLKKKVVEWGISHGSKSRRISRGSALKLSHGRLWVTVRSTQPEDEDDESLQDALDDLKGAYQLSKPGIYKQPAPQGSEKGIQHRLLRGSVGLWVIEKYNFEKKVWNTRAREEPDGRWVDLRNNEMIHVRLVPLLSVLEKLREGGTSFEDVEKNLDFLFNSCNQKKLNGKLRTRNLKHNIANLKAKLDKQYALSFAVTVARTADSIAE